MPAKNPKEVFVQLLSHVRHGTERGTEFFKEISQVAQDPDVKEALEARVFIAENILARIDKCFSLIGEQPVKPSRRVTEMFVDDFRKELAEIQNPVAKTLFVLATVNQIVHMRIAEYMTLVSAADMTGHYAVGVLLETCLADQIALVERTRRLIRTLVETKVQARIAA